MLKFRYLKTEHVLMRLEVCPSAFCSSIAAVLFLRATGADQ